MNKRAALCLLLLAAGILVAVSVLTARETNAAAYACAMASERTDGAIAACYTDRGLPAPHVMD